MSQSIIKDGTAEAFYPAEDFLQEGTENGNTPALSVNATCGRGILNLDLSGYAEKEHTHEEYIKKEDDLITEFRTETLFTGNAKDPGYYPLSQDITKFRYVIIFAAAYNPDYGKFVQKTSLWYDIEDLEFTADPSEWSIIFQKNAYINGTFTNNNTFEFKGYAIGEHGAQYLTVRKIIGVY